MSKDRENTPRANILMGSMRSIGYTFESAIADVIDNSISAHCTNVYLLFPENPLEELAVGILDDGCGMSDSHLFEAMRYGSSSSEDQREIDDLGRFGLGMKSASMSMCRKLTVASKYKGEIHAYTWDYNYIKQKEAWIIEEHTKAEIKNLDIGKYILRETKTRKEYKIALEQNITIEWGKTLNLTIENEKIKGKVKITKIR